MIVDFQHHFTPRELIKEDPGDRLILHYDAQGAPSYTIHKLLYDLDEHVRMMDEAGIDAAWLTSAQGMCADLETSRFVNDKAKQAERDYPGRFIGAAHAHPHGGPEAMKALDRHPNLIVHMAHLSGGIASMLGRIRSYQDKDFWGTKGNPRHGMNPKKDFDYYLNNNMVFDTAGFAGAISSVKTALVEIPST